MSRLNPPFPFEAGSAEEKLGLSAEVDAICPATDNNGCRANFSNRVHGAKPRRAPFLTRGAAVASRRTRLQQEFIR